ncbi:hypothetical protein ACGE24_05645 [Corynebacterium kroppenstedtii]|uniref:hypothetical protein n=1 Tax=Corynebacterium sp. PCR 32 TaxID=3351342 RepID=UPI0030A2FEDF
MATIAQLDTEAHGGLDIAAASGEDKQYILVSSHTIIPVEGVSSLGTVDGVDVCYLDDIDLSGPCAQYVVTWDKNPSSETYPLTLNQHNHLASVNASGRSSWLGGSFLLPDNLTTPTNTTQKRDTTDPIAHAIHTLITDYDALRLAATADGSSQHLWPANALHITTADLITDPHTDHATIRHHLEQRIDDVCAPGRTPGLFFAICGERLLVAIDHFHADMASINIILRRLWALLTTPPAAADAIPTPDPSTAPSFIDAVRHECDAASWWNDPTNRTELDNKLEVWRRFFHTTGGVVPAFPAALGTTESMTSRHRTELLIPAAKLNTASTSGSFADILSALATSVHTVTGADSLPCVVPIHTRGRSSSPYHGTVGWMVSNGPMIATPGDVDGIRTWLREGIRAVTVPLNMVMDRFHPAMPTPQPFMVSYSDFRTGPGRSASIPGSVYFSSLAPTATVQLWLTRNDAGLSLRAKYPGTADAEAIMDACISDLTHRLAAA